MPGDSRPDPAKSSFVLTNVFAGCPLNVRREAPFLRPWVPVRRTWAVVAVFLLQVLCATSWTYVPKGASDAVVYIIVGAETGLYILETSGDRRELVQVRAACLPFVPLRDQLGLGTRASLSVPCVGSLLTSPA